MTLILDPRVLEQSSRDLTRHGLDVDEAARVPYPDTGATSGYSRDAVEHLVEGAADLAGSLRELADALGVVVAGARLTDAQVGDLFDRLLAGALR